MASIVTRSLMFLGLAFFLAVVVISAPAIILIICQQNVDRTYATLSITDLPPPFMEIDPMAQHSLDAIIKSGDRFIMPVDGHIDTVRVGGLRATATVYVNGKAAGQLHSPSRPSDKPIGVSASDELELEVSLDAENEP